MNARSLALIALTSFASSAPLTALAAPVEIAAGGSSGSSHTCALMPAGKLHCWGSNDAGQLGLGDLDARGDQPDEMGANLESVDLGPGAEVVALAVGGRSTCVVLADESLRCFGANAKGQLGQGDTYARGDGPDMGESLLPVVLPSGRTVDTVSVGLEHTCVVLDDGSVRCWGEGGSGRLGANTGSTADRGDVPSEMGNALAPVVLGAGNKAAELALGGTHSCARLENGSVKCWGSNARGQLGQGDPDARGDNANEMAALQGVPLGVGRTAVAIGAGVDFTCALLDDDTVKCWGDNAFGQLGQGDLTHRGDHANEMGDDLPPIPLGRPAVGITVGYSHACATLDDGTAKCWGRGTHGRLGRGNTLSYGDQLGEMASLTAVQLGAGGATLQLAAGPRHTCALLQDGRVKCWGQGTQLGLGTTNNRGDGPNEMGDNLPAVDLPEVELGAFYPGYAAFDLSLFESELNAAGASVDPTTGTACRPEPPTLPTGPLLRVDVSTAEEAMNALDAGGSEVHLTQDIEDTVRVLGANNRLYLDGFTLDTLELGDPGGTACDGETACVRTAANILHVIGGSRPGAPAVVGTIRHLAGIGSSPANLLFDGVIFASNTTELSVNLPATGRVNRMGIVNSLIRGSSVTGANAACMLIGGTNVVIANTNCTSGVQTGTIEDWGYRMAGGHHDGVEDGQADKHVLVDSMLRSRQQPTVRTGHYVGCLAGYSTPGHREEDDRRLTLINTYNGSVLSTIGVDPDAEGPLPPVIDVDRIVFTHSRMVAGNTTVATQFGPKDGVPAWMDRLWLVGWNDWLTAGPFHFYSLARAHGLESTADAGESWTFVFPEDENEQDETPFEYTTNDISTLWNVDDHWPMVHGGESVGVSYEVGTDPANVP